MAVDPARAKSLFLAASEVASPAERAAYLDRECGDDAELRARVESLLAADAGDDEIRRPWVRESKGTISPRTGRRARPPSRGATMLRCWQQRDSDRTTL